MESDTLQSYYFIISILVTFGAVFFWVSFSLKEFLDQYHVDRDKSKLRHLKYLEEFREELNKRRSF